MAKVSFHFVRGNIPKKFASTLVNFMGKVSSLFLLCTFSNKNDSNNKSLYQFFPPELSEKLIVALALTLV